MLYTLQESLDVFDGSKGSIYVAPTIAPINTMDGVHNLINDLNEWSAKYGYTIHVINYELRVLGQILVDHTPSKENDMPAFVAIRRGAKPPTHAPNKFGVYSSRIVGYLASRTNGLMVYLDMYDDIAHWSKVAFERAMLEPEFVALGFHSEHKNQWLERNYLRLVSKKS